MRVGNCKVIAHQILAGHRFHSATDSKHGLNQKTDVTEHAVQLKRD